MNRSTRVTLARQTVEIVERGAYDTPGGEVVIAPLVEACLASTQHYAPEQLEAIRQEVLAVPAPADTTTIEVRNETTLAGIARLAAETGQHVAALNFASAKNPGGGFLSGSQAQEESLARSSALYASLLRAPEYYERHRASRSCLYSDAMILSPDCPVFRDDEGRLLAQPLTATFITSAAPNAGAIASNTPQEAPLIPAAFHRRAEYVLALAAHNGHSVLVLGAWGCGVFRNDPSLVAGTFASHLIGGPWAKRFQRVVFSVLDTSLHQETFLAFRRALQAPTV
jgi:uncharacterized protein (TIGR02452 family)